MSDKTSPEPQPVQAWHSLTAPQVLAALESRREGLTTAQANQRLTRYGANRLESPQRRSLLMRFLSQFHNLLIYVLLAAGLTTALLGHWLDTTVIVSVVVINAILGFLQEGRAEQAMEAIRKMLTLRATVVREGRRMQIPAHAVVPGDIVLLQSGDKVVADLRLLETKNLRIEEAALTGESAPTEKSTAALPASTPIGDRTNMAYSGTLVVYGQGIGVAGATGDYTELGRINRLLATVEAPRTPLLQQMTVFGRRLTLAILMLAGTTLAMGVLLYEHALETMFMAAVGLAVAAIPEGLPAILTITLALGLQKMARRNAIIRQLPAVETLGAVTVICTDKTGTLTRNEMTVQRVSTADHLFEVSGAGYAPSGGFSLAGQAVRVDAYAVLRELAQAALLCNDARLYEHDGHWSIEGDPTEGALVPLAIKTGLEPAKIHALLPRLDSIPFESERRYMATLHQAADDHKVIYIKGAPERILRMCTHQQGERLAPLDPDYWQDQALTMAKLGQRLLALAIKPMPDDCYQLDDSDLSGGFILLGLVGIIDPPREEAREAVRLCQAAGIRIKMITGDHAVTATAIGQQLGIGDGRRALTGNDLEALSQTQLEEAVRQTDIFARASPEHKLRLVTALQGNGEVVAMTGDGVNDAPALKQADVGIAMGMKGTEAAKEAAAVVLADDNFASIAHAVEEGRTVYDNLKKTMIYILPTNTAEAGMLSVAILLDMVLPITPVQILWVNMVTAVTLAVALAFEGPEADVMRRLPRPPRQAILSGWLIWHLLFSAALMIGGAFGLFLWSYRSTGDLEISHTLAVNALVMAEIAYLFNCRYLQASSLSWRGLFGSPYVLFSSGLLLIIQLGFTYLPLMQTFFGTTNLSWTHWLAVLGFGVGLFLLIELEKQLLQRFGSSSGQRLQTCPS